jgi:hypothetical protein
MRVQGRLPALDRAEFALEQLRKKVDEVRRKRASAKTPKEIGALDSETAEGNDYKRSAMRFTPATQPRISGCCPMQNPVGDAAPT